MPMHSPSWMPEAEKWIQDYREEMIRDIQALVRIPSVSRPDQAAPGAPFGPECRRALDHMLARGADFGFQTRDLDGRACALSMGDDDNAIGIIAHLDVVPVGEGWAYPPFEGVWLPERDALIGRGGDDNKGPAIAALYMMRMMRELGIPMRHGIRLYCGTSEENGMMDMRGARDAGEAFPALSLVPDARFPVNYGQKGSLKGAIQARIDGNLKTFRSGSVVNIIPDLAECVVETGFAEAKKAVERLNGELRNALETEETENGVRIRAHGVSGHAARPESSVNAIHLLAQALAETGILTGSGADAIRALAELTADAWGISEGADFEDEISGKTTLVYSVAGLENGVLRVGLDCRYAITQPAEELQEKLEAAWTRMGFSAAGLTVTQPVYISPEDPRVAALQEVYRTITGREDEPYTMGGGTYSRAVPNAISFGFGIPDQERDYSFLPEGHGHAHGRDEALWMDKIETGMKIYAAAMTALDEII